jgi:hypothetical protein
LAVSVEGMEKGKLGIGNRGLAVKGIDVGR